MRRRWRWNFQNWRKSSVPLSSVWSSVDEHPGHYRRGKDWFEKYVPYYTTFNESYNLQENASVKLFKADIGKVQKVTLVQNRVRVKLLILDQYASRIRQDAIAVVESPTLIGSEYISIIPGSADAPLLLPDGEIPSKEKRSLTDIMAEFEVEKTAKMVVETMQNLSDIAQRLSDPEGPLWSALNNVNRISGNIEAITADLKTGKGPIGALMTSESLLQSMQERLVRIDAILASVQTAADKTPENDNSCERQSRHVPGYRRLHSGQGG